MGKCQAMNTFSRCAFNAMWTVTVLTEQLDSCGVHLKDAFMYALELCGNAVDGDVNITLHWNGTMGERS